MEKEDIDSTLLNIAFMQTAIYGATSENGMAINKLRPVSLFADFRVARCKQENYWW